MSRGTVFVTDAQMRSSLAVIRSLGKQGLDVTAGEETRYATGAFSRYCNRRLVYPSPKRKEEQFIEYLLETLRSTETDAIFPVADACLKPIIDHEEEISRYTQIALPPRDIFMKGYDKGVTLRIALDNGIPCPRTFFPENPDDAARIAGEIDYPVVVKPRVSSGRRGVRVCRDPETLIQAYAASASEFGPVVIQEFIPYGGELGVYTLLNERSELRAVTVQRRIRSYPISGGASTLRETIKDERSQAATEIALHLLKAMRWSGVAMVEFRIDARDGSLKLMEVNPRFWGSLHLSILSGVDFPYLLYQMLRDGDVEPVPDYQEGVECRWLLPGDILWYLSAPKTWQNLKEFLRFNTPDDILSLHDPGPTLGFVLATARYALDSEMWRFVLRR
ncbi:ATP-grasp domain-containing protein [Methanoculleus sp.]|uniref:carboxylate--amine ligase n=2 Tax=Methanoculleus sp. TaxID=90427 RepID=UPI0026303624|nr:ATP-grasp domain-containing protein [Methanoculleus sp.]MCK9297339.1 ATP-grasp domain-containing protein [Methanoculleus sp.]MDD2254044.1 ATP-grasp domain-containing protein [Methanoculleus sp.]MDD2786602.1 ATP-grasp domain-containing protein [Methanoculleus sp.]MDD4313353.1 ATP-grasp domain-containing protein [Methanoculleus sp.]